MSRLEIGKRMQRFFLKARNENIENSNVGFLLAVVISRRNKPRFVQNSCRRNCYFDFRSVQF